MKYLLFTIASFFTILSIQAQDIEITEGTEFKYDNHILFTAPYEDGYVALSVDGMNWGDRDVDHDSHLRDNNGQTYLDGDEKVFITRLSSKLAIKKKDKKARAKTEMLPEIKSKRYNLYAFENIGGKLYMYYTKYTKKAKKVAHCVMEINVEKPRSSKETVLSVEKFKKKKPRSLFLKNKDASVVVFVTDPYGKKKDDSYINAIAYSTADHSELWFQTFKTGKMKKQIIFKELHLAENGTLFVSYKDYKKDNDKMSYKTKDGKKRPAYKQYIIALSDKETQQIELDLGKNYGYKCNLKSNEKNLIVCGTYASRHKGNLAGVYSSVVDLETFTVSVAKKKDFDTDLLIQLDDEDIATDKKKDPGIESYAGLGTIINEANGQIKYIYEPYRVKVVTHRSGVNNAISSQTPYYIAKSIIVVDITDDINFSTIPRSVKFANDFRAIKTKTVEADNEIYLMYLDHRENIKGKKKKKKGKKGFKLKELKKSQDGVMAIAKFNEDNTVSRKILKDLKKEDFYFNPSFMTRVAQDRYLVTGISDGFFKSRKQKNLLLAL